MEKARRVQDVKEESSSDGNEGTNSEGEVAVQHVVVWPGTKSRATKRGV